MIIISVFDSGLLPLDAQIYIANGNKIIAHTQCNINGQLILTDIKPIIGGRYMIRIRYAEMSYAFKPIEFYLDRDDGYDLEFCVRMESDI